MESLPLLRALLLGPGPSSRFPELPHWELVRAESLEEAAETLEKGSFQVAVIDGCFPPVANESCLSTLNKSHPGLPLLILATEPAACRLATFRREGAEAVLGPKDLADPKTLAETLSWAVEQARARENLDFELEDAKADLTLQRTAYLKLKDGQKAAYTAMQAMSECNRLLFILEDEHVYVRNFCRILVKRMGLRMAWAGFVQKDAEGVERLVPAGHAGYERNYLTRFKLKSWERRFPKSLAIKVISSGEPVAIQDLESPSVEFFRVEEALRRGYRSVLLLPLKSSSDSRGILCLYSGEPGAFGTSEIAYFSQVAGELAHGVHLLRREAQHRIEITATKP
jgi:hypothetical protein